MWKVCVGLIGVTCLCAIGLSHAQTPRHKSHAEKQIADARSVRFKDPVPCTCPYQELFPLEEPNWFYYAERYPTACNEPEVSAMYGANIALAEYCEDDECVGDSSRTKKAEKQLDKIKDFRGYTKPIHLQYEHSLPGREWTRLHVGPRFIRFVLPDEDEEQEDYKYAKVFAYYIDLQARYHNPSLTNKIIYLAIQLKEDHIPAAFETVDAELTTFYEPNQGLDHYAFRAVIEPKHGGDTQQTHMLLVMAGEEEGR